ncbi:unnamed protein product [Effrenium voratum]|uniref:Uncharacterized protein n=1 Tax=Effrenium voratum TaxID=2562239 RepID=A0AA36I2T8_9DINO|nr:unnamed protein product [Effrenium voratum]
MLAAVARSGVASVRREARRRKDDSGDLQRKDVRKEILFVFLSSLPRASLQGALGFVPIKERFFGGGPEARSACLFIADSARLYIMIMSLVGSTLLHRLGPVLLAEEHAAKERRRRDDEAWRRRTSGLLGPRNQLRQHQSRDPIFGQNRLFSDKTPEDPEDDEERGRRVLVTFEAGGLPKQDEPVQLKEMKDARRAGGSECTKKLLSERSASFPVIQSSTAGSAPGVLLPVSVNEETQQEERKEEEKVEKEGGFIRRPERTWARVCLGNVPRKKASMRTAKTSSGFLRHATLEELTLDTDFQSALRTIQTVYGISGGSGPSSDELVKYLDDKYSAPVRVQMPELDDIGPMTSKFRSLHQF